MAMLRSPVRPLVFSLLGRVAVVAAACSSIACTLVLNPRDDVERCETADDCPPTGDNRYVAECRFDPDADLTSDDASQICIGGFKKNIGCNPMNYVGADDHPFSSTFERLASSTRYSCADTPGVRGCPPEAGVGCMGDLVVTDGICDVSEPSASNPTISLSGQADLVGQDVLDQFCRSFFCDDAFVCDTTDFTCVPCRSDAPFGEGGCGTVYVAGAPSCVYTPDTRAVCDGPDADVDAPKFGNCDS
jgi:hypothetical protein